jgi:hypothetical protein
MATKSIGTLKASLILDTRGFLLGFQKAGAAVKQATGGIGSAIASVAASTGAKLTAIGTGALASVASIHTLAESFSRLDRSAKLSDRLGLTFEAMQKVSIAARLGGIDVDILAKAMLKMGNEVGSGGKPLDQRLLDVAAAIQAMPDPTRRAAMAIKVFGKEGPEVLTAIGRNAFNIRAASEAIDRFGLAMSRADVGKIEAANDSLAKLAIVTQSVIDKLAVQLAPVIERSSERALHSLERLLGGVERLDEGLGRLFSAEGGLGKLVGFLDQQLFMLATLPDRIADTLGIAPSALKGIPKSGPSTNGRGPDIFGSGDALSKQVRPGAFERNSIEAVRAVQNAGGDGTSAIVAELKKAVAKLTVIADDARKDSLDKDGVVFREGRI